MYKNSHLRKIIFIPAIPAGIHQLLVFCGQIIWVVYFPCTDAKTNRSGNSHFCATQRHNQQDPGRVAQEGMVQAHTPEVSPAVSQTQVNTGALIPYQPQLTQNIKAASNHLLCTLDCGR